MLGFSWYYELRDVMADAGGDHILSDPVLPFHFPICFFFFAVSILIHFRMWEAGPI